MLKDIKDPEGERKKREVIKEVIYIKKIRINKNKGEPEDRGWKREAEKWIWITEGQFIWSDKASFNLQSFVGNLQGVLQRLMITEPDRARDADSMRLENFIKNNKLIKYLIYVEKTVAIPERSV